MCIILVSISDHLFFSSNSLIIISYMIIIIIIYTYLKFWFRFWIEKSKIILKLVKYFFEYIF